MEGLKDLTGNVVRKVIPTDTNVPPETIEVIHICLMEFMGMLLGEASLIATSNAINNANSGAPKSKHGVCTIRGDEVVAALESLGFRDHAQVAAAYLAKIRKS